MPIPNYKGRSADQIAKIRNLDDSDWQIHTSLSWCDYAERNNAPMALHYAAFHLRTGIEQLWSEILCVAKGGSMSRTEYRSALSKTTTLYKLIDSQSPYYEKFAKFIQLVASVDSRIMPPTVIWEMSRLKRIHGGCGEQLLHFQGISLEGYLSDAWIEGRLMFVRESALWIAKTMESRGNMVVYAPEGLKKPEVFSLWERYRDGKIDEADVRNGLKIVQPIVMHRPSP